MSASDVSIEDFEKTWRRGGLKLRIGLSPDSALRPYNGEVQMGTHHLLQQRCSFQWRSGWSALRIVQISPARLDPLAGGCGITVNRVAPALIQDTAMMPGSNEELTKNIPIGRLGEPEEVAETVIWMVKTGYVTNKVIGVDGGFFARGTM